MRIAAASPLGARRAPRADAAGAPRADHACVPRVQVACAPHVVETSVRVEALAALDLDIRSRGSVTARSALSFTTSGAVAFR